LNHRVLSKFIAVLTPKGNLIGKIHRMHHQDGSILSGAASKKRFHGQEQGRIRRMIAATWKRSDARRAAPRAGHPNDALTIVRLVPIARQNSPRGLCKRASTEVEDT